VTSILTFKKSMNWFRSWLRKCTLTRRKEGDLISLLFLWEGKYAEDCIPRGSRNGVRCSNRCQNGPTIGLTL
jgi:hypothetical protein